MRFKVPVLLIILAFATLGAQFYWRLGRERNYLKQILAQRSASTASGWREAWGSFLLEHAGKGELPRDFVLAWSRSGKKLVTPFFPTGKAQLDWTLYRQQRAQGRGQDFLKHGFELAPGWDRMLALQEWHERFRTAPGVALTPFERSQLDPEAHEAYRRIFALFDGHRDFTLAQTHYSYDGAFFRLLPDGNIEALVPAVATLEKQLLPTFLARNGIPGAKLLGNPWAIEFTETETNEPRFPLSDAVLMATVCALLLGGAGLYFRGVKEERRQLLGRTRFLDQVVHELKTPLAGAKLHIQLLRRAAATVVPPSLVAAEAAVERMDRLFNEIMALHRPIDGTSGLILSGATVAQVVASCVAVTPVPVNVEGDAAFPVQGEETRLRLVLGNLLDNAAAYGSQVAIEVSASPEWLTLTVADNGPGIPWSERGTIFQEFVRGQGAAKLRPGGMGLGLAIARKLTGEMGGELELLNPGAAGARFALRLRRQE